MSVMVESVLSAIEIKSHLDLDAVDDFFKKTFSLRALEFKPGGMGSIRALATAFAYSCDNMNLRFFDFSVRSWRSGHMGPSGICVLNQGYFGLTDRLQPIDSPRKQAIPCFFRVGEDALLVYIYFLTKWVTAGTSAAETYLRYSESMFKSISLFMFDAAFLDLISGDSEACKIARKRFEGTADAEIYAPYKLARMDLGL